MGISGRAVSKAPVCLEELVTPKAGAHEHRPTDENIMLIFCCRNLEKCFRQG